MWATYYIYHFNLLNIHGLGNCSHLNLDVKHVSRNTIVSNVLKFHNELKEKLKHVMKKCYNRVWWLIVGLHVNKKDILVWQHILLTTIKDCRVRIFFFFRMKPPHSDEEMTNKVFECLTEWEIDRKLFFITLDNASANNCLQEIFNE